MLTKTSGCLIVLGGWLIVACGIWALPRLLIQAKPSAPSRRDSLSRIPFIGCKSDGQVGALRAPQGKSVQVPVATSTASLLGYYKAEEGFGVLAPRNWYCFDTYGSSGSNLYVSPKPINRANFFSGKWKGFTGPAIQLTTEDGGTSGRFEVARVIARVFPAYKTFAQKVIDEGLDPSSDFPFGPYPVDKLTYKSSGTVEYETPPLTDGLGTSSWLLKNASPINGVATLLGQTPDLLYLAVRLRPKLTNLTSVIILQAEQNTSHDND